MPNAQDEIMPDEFVIRVATSFKDVKKEQWEKLIGASKTHHAKSYNPFVSHAFLNTVEQTGCATADTGWLGQHLLLEDSQGNLLAAMPSYLKTHSQGEYVFDHAWADAWERAGGRYYPKLQAAIPFTPATGPRLLVSPDIDAPAARAALAQGYKTLVERHGISSAHVTFAQEADIDALTKAGFLHRIDQQFHFTNNDYKNYDDFLETLSSRKRKNLKKERVAATQNGITIEALTGVQLTEDVMERFYEFYIDTGSRKWGRPYLNRQFFLAIAEQIGDDIVLIMAKREGRYIAGAINFLGGETIFGRNWGCVEDHPILHFEVCYHQAIDFAIAHGLKTVEAGAQGEHKLARGYLPVATHSAHFIPHEGFKNAIADFLKHERAEVARFGEILKDHGPFKKSG